MKTYLYKLFFKTPVQINSDPLSLESPEIIIHSDTLYSAIFNSYIRLFGNLDESYLKDPPFLLSSAFPFSKSELFFPKPRVPLKISNDLKNFPKKIKNAKFISRKLFEDFINAKELSINEDSFYLQGFVSENKLEDFFKVQEVPRCRVSKITYLTEIFYSSRVVFNKDSGLFFLVVFKNEEEKKAFDSALALLGDSGIGGERSIGFGRFSVDNFDERFEVNEKPSSDYFVSLSLYHPSKNEIQTKILEDSSYDLIKRQNWVFSNGAKPIRSKSIRMFTEGSIFKNCYEAKGEVVDITPSIIDSKKYFEHKVYRSGILFKIALTTNLER